MDAIKITLAPLEPDDREQFISDNQEAFRFGAMEEFGCRDAHMESPGEIISRATIEQSMDAAGAETLRILKNGRPVGGAVVKINPATRRNALDLLFVSPAEHTKGIGFRAWMLIEERYPDTLVWETHTPYFETRNIHFYINKCGFQAVEFFNRRHSDPHAVDGGDDGFEMFRFEKRMKSE